MRRYITFTFILTTGFWFSTWFLTATVSHALTLPVGQRTLRVEVDEDGIYEIVWRDLAQNGFDLQTLDPHTIQMMHRGEPVRYQWVGDDDHLFEVGESVRFYGWAFDGSRHDQLFVDKNVFWLWAADPTLPHDMQSPSTFDESIGNDLVNETEMHPFLWAWQSTVTHAPANFFSRTGSNQWAAFPNEADAWYWTRLRVGETLTAEIDIPHPAQTDVALVDIELFAQYELSHTVETGIGKQLAQKTWYGPSNVNVYQVISATELITTGINLFTFTVNSSAPADKVMLNEVRVTYDREFEQIDDQLVFTIHDDWEAYTHGWPTHELGDFIAWDVTEPTQPQGITLTLGDILWDHEDNAVRIGRTCDPPLPKSEVCTYVVAHLDGIKRPKSRTVYIPQEINPPHGAEWLAITPSEFIPELERLAAHRQAFNDVTTYIVDVDQIIQQIGYGYALPEAIQAYIRTAILTWNDIPRWVLLGGDATVNPLGRDCVGCPIWNATEVPSGVPTDMQFTNYWAGLIGTDYTYALAVGDDLFPDVAVGRLPARTGEQMASMITKTMLYDEAIANDESWLQNGMTISDNEDLAGDFCQSNQTFISDTAKTASLNWTQLCLDRYQREEVVTSQASINMRDDLFLTVGIGNVGLTHYRGHGLVHNWAGGMIRSSRDDMLWKNADRPTIHMSAACLDADFSNPERTSLAEQFLVLEGRGTVAHLGSTGLETLQHHEQTYEKLAEGAWEIGYPTVGEAILYANRETVSNALGRSYGFEYYTRGLGEFHLLGDPALSFPAVPERDLEPIRPFQRRAWLPIISVNGTQ